MKCNMAGSSGKNRRFFVSTVSDMWSKRFLIFIGTVSFGFFLSNFRFMWGNKLIPYRYSWQGVRYNGEVS